jgi:hypothetical protein
MRTVEEVKQMIKQVETSIEYHDKWYADARKKYEDAVYESTMTNVRADDSEMRAAASAYWEVKRELLVLNWVLNEGETVNR